MRSARGFQNQIVLVAVVLFAAGAGLAAKPVAHGIVREVSAAQAKAIWKKWKRTHVGVSDMTSSQRGQPEFWLRVPSCKISTLVLQESDEDALHRFPAVRQLDSGGLVVFAHRDLHFHELAKLREGDKISVENVNGSVAVYEVSTLRILLPEEVSSALVAPENGDSLYLLTCYPFRYLGAAPKRFLVEGIRCAEQERR
jgi:LPXTG-site transpeptidase (sortase) family protein